MKDFMKWLHMVVCMISTMLLLAMAGATNVTKDQFILALVIYIYMILLAVALFKENQMNKLQSVGSNLRRTFDMLIDKSNISLYFRLKIIKNIWI